MTPGKRAEDEQGAALRVAGYRLRATLRRRWPGYLSLLLCIGCLGGLAMGSIAGARRTQASFPVYFESVDPPELAFISGIVNPTLGSTVGYNPTLVRRIAHLPHVSEVESASGIDVLPLTKTGRPYEISSFPPAAGNGVGSDNGLYFKLDRATVVSGRLAKPGRVNEVMMLQEVAELAHLRVGDVLRLGIYTNAQTELPKFGSAAVRPFHTYVVELVGTFVLAQQLIQDDVDNSASLVYFTPALSRSLLACCSNYTETAVKVRGGSAFVPRVVAEVRAVLPTGFPPPALTSDALTKAQRSIQPEWIGLGVFGLIAALATLLIAAQIIARQLRLESEDRRNLRALGAGRATDLADALLGVLACVVGGAALAVGIAVALSPLAPIGPVRPYYPYPGVAFDGAVLFGGLAVLVLVLSLVSVAIALRQAPLAVDARRSRLPFRGSSLARAASSANCPPTMTMGIRFALEPGGGRNAVPVRSTIIGTLLAFVVVVSTLTFGASLQFLVAHPNLYGWNWNYILSGGGGSGDIPRAAATRLLTHDPLVGSWSGAYFDDLTMDGQSVPVIGETPGAAVQPPLLSGQRLEEPNEVVLGANTLAQLHTKVGGTVIVTSGFGPPVHLRVIGTATMPAIGGPGPHLEMGSGAVLDYHLIPPAARDPFNDPVRGPESIFVTVRSGQSSVALERSLVAMEAPLSNNFNFGVFVGSVLRPAEIINYRSMSATPTLLALALCVGAVVALTLTLLSSVRRRRRDLALLKSLGFTRRQLGSTIAWQSSIAVGIGMVVGIPLGVVLGRYLWDLFANEINAVPAPSIPLVTIIATAVAGFVLAIAVSVIPGVLAARAPTATLLRTE